MKIISISELIRKPLDSAFRPDTSFTISAQTLGPPDWWDFGGADPFSAMLGYGDLRIELWGVESRVEIRRIGLKLWDAMGGEPTPKKKVKINKRVKINLAGYLPGMDLGAVRNKLEAENLAFVESRFNNASETKAVLAINKHTEFVFFSMQGRIALAEIQLFSELPGA